MSSRRGASSSAASCYSIGQNPEATTFMKPFVELIPSRAYNTTAGHSTLINLAKK